MASYPPTGMGPNKEANGNPFAVSGGIAQFMPGTAAAYAYNAGPGAVAACGCVPAIPETQAYVARILGLLGGAGEVAGATLEVRLLE